MNARLPVIASVVVIVLALAAFAMNSQWLQTRTVPDLEQASAVDIGFAQFMSLHHEQAISMSHMLLRGPEPTPLKTVALTIALSQMRELGRMEGWLQAWGQGLKPDSTGMGWMLLGKTPPDEKLKRYLIDCESSPTGMPGLATLAELEALRQLKGKERDRKFLQLMIAHHEGGIPMAEFASVNAEVGAVRSLARLIVMEQSEEIMRLYSALAAIDAMS